MNQRKVIRSGYTLIELVMVLAVVSVIATLSATLVHAMLRQQSAAARQLATGSSLIRVGDRFRSDVNAALDAKVSDEEIVLGQLGERSVSWRRDGESMIRTVKVGPDVRNDHFDVLPNHGHLFTRKSIAGGSEFIEMEIKPDDSLADSAEANVDTSSQDPRHATGSRGTVISAELGRDQRWRQPRESKPEVAQ